MKLRERYILWRLTPAEQLIYRMLKCPEEWEGHGSSYTLYHKHTKIGVWTGDRDDAKRVSLCRIQSPTAPDYRPGRFARKVFFRMAREIKYPSPPSNREVGKRLFQYLMKCELGEEK